MFTLYQTISVDGSRVEFSLSPVLFEMGIVNENFWAQYENFDLRNIDESLLNIPLLLNIAPVLWAMNLDVIVPKIDRELLYSLGVLREKLREMYPRVLWGGDISAAEVCDTENRLADKSAVFFSGGLDSVFSTIRHLDERPILVTVRGSDVSLSDDTGWRTVLEETKKFGDRYGLEAISIETNFFDFLNQDKLGRMDPSISSWWGGVQHGMGFAGLVAPYVERLALAKVYIASTHSKGFAAPWGSNPQLDNSIRYFSLSFVHDGFDHSRHSKIINLLKDCQESGSPLPILRVCYSNSFNSGKNCCNCEKCFRTAVALWIEGQDPFNLGFEIPLTSLIKKVKMMFSKPDIHFDDNTLFHWSDIQSNVKSKSFYVQREFSSEFLEFIDFVKDFDFQKFRVQSERRRSSRKRLRRLILNYRLTRYIFDLLKSVRRP